MQPDKTITHTHTLLPIKAGIHTSPAVITAPTSITALNKYGISTSHMRFSLQNTPNIPTKMHHALSYYKILHWDVDYLKLAVTNGIILREGIRFNVIYIGCTKADVLASKTGQALLSFRAAQKEYDLPAYVLIKPLLRKPKARI